MHFTLREWTRLTFNVTSAEVERAKAQLKASILLSLDGTTAVAEDIGRQIITTGRRNSAQDIEEAVGKITEKDVMDFASRKIWDQDLAISALGSIEGMLDYNRSVHLAFICFPIVLANGSPAAESGTTRPEPACKCTHGHTRINRC